MNVRKPKIGEHVVAQLGNRRNRHTEAVVMRIAYHSRYPDDMRYIEVEYRTWYGSRRKWITSDEIAYLNSGPGE